MWECGNVADYAFHTGPRVNETSDEKRNLPCLLSLTQLDRALPPLLFHGLFHRVRWLGEMEGRATRLRRWWVFNLFNIYMSYSGLTPVLSIWNCLWPEPPSRTPDSVYHIRTCSVADPAGPWDIWSLCLPLCLSVCLSLSASLSLSVCLTLFLSLSPGAIGDRKSHFDLTELRGLLNLLLFTLHSWRANLRYFNSWSVQKCQTYLVGGTWPRWLLI